MSSSESVGRVPCAIAIAASTGGPRVLTELVRRLPHDLPAAVFIVQHMPATFTRHLAARLDALCALPVREAEPNEPVRAGRISVAPGGYHLGLTRTGDEIRIELAQTAPVWGLRPAADVLFVATACHFGARSIGIVLTGMGRDGAQGLRAIRDAGGWTAVQQEATAAIASMPRAAAAFAAACLPVERLADAVHAQALRLAGDAAR
jgi:two-component system, chemotaxis family, protein-glutamate methylesterase/glutaminase